MGVKLWSLAIANMFVLVLTLLATVAASPLPSQVSRQAPVETPELAETEDLAVEASSHQASHSRVPSGAIAAILAAANAEPTAIDRSPGYGKRSADESEVVEDDTEDLAVETISHQASNSRVPSGAIAAILAAANAEPKPIDRSPGYGKRSADNKDESEVAEDDTEDLAVEASSHQASLSRVPSAVRLAILSAANAEPTAVVRSPGYGKRSAENKDESEAKLGLVVDVPLDAVKVKIHSSHGNIAQQYDGDTEYQNAVLGSRFGRGKRETDNFIPFSEYDSRRVNTLKLEQNDFLALPARLQSQSQEKKKRHFSES